MKEIKIEKPADPAVCPICGGRYKYTVPELVECTICGNKEKSTYGVVKDFLDENGYASALDISKAIGVPVGKINIYLSEGKLEIPESSEIFIKCRRCGIEIRFGKYCKNCANELCRELGAAISIDEGEIGEIPRKFDGKMRFANRDK